MYSITEIFESIQGEGLRIGEPSVFLRTAGCNLECPHCDTKNSWKKGTDMTWEEINFYLAMAKGPIVLTGGEPLLYPRLVDHLIHSSNEITGRLLTIETNGTIAPSLYHLASNWALWSVSPKLPWFCPDYKWDYDVLRKFNVTGGHGKVQWKIVVQNGGDIEEALELLAPIESDAPVIFQPPNDLDRDWYLEDLSWLAHYVLTHYPGHRIRVLPQLHILMENTR